MKKEITIAIYKFPDDEIVDQSLNNPEIQFSPLW
jgi:hypothetical protein